MESLRGLVWRVLTQDCKGGKALNTTVNMLCAAVLLWGAPKAWHLYWELRDEITELLISSRSASVVLTEHERRLTSLDKTVADHIARDDERFDHINDLLPGVRK